MLTINIGEKIRHYRKLKKLSMKKLGELVGLSEQAIGNYERGDRKVDFVTLDEIATALECSIIDLLSDEEERKKESTLRDAIEILLECKGYSINDINPDEYVKIENYLLQQIDIAIEFIK